MCLGEASWGVLFADARGQDAGAGIDSAEAHVGCSGVVETARKKSVGSETEVLCLAVQPGSACDCADSRKHCCDVDAETVIAAAVATLNNFPWAPISDRLASSDDARV